MAHIPTLAAFWSPGPWIPQQPHPPGSLQKRVLPQVSPGMVAGGGISMGWLVLGCSCCHVVPILFRRVKTISPDIKEFFSQACSLRHVSLAGTKLPADAVRCDWAVGNGFGVGIAWGDLDQGWWGDGWKRL